MTYRKKLIEVPLPLNAINEQSAREKSIRHGHPSTLHLWWARRPLAACRAVLFASLIDDPSEHPEVFPTEQAQQQERERLFKLITTMVQWEQANNEDTMAQVRAEIRKATGDNPPPVLDPFAGGGSIPLEAQRLGLEAHASDLNPVAVLINKALIEIPPKFADCPPVNPDARQSLIGGNWSGARGLADDIRYYGKWMRDEAERRIGYLYPKVTLPKEYGGGEARVIAWLWARTVTCPNPACGAQMPLVSSFYLSKKKGKEAWVEPVVDHETTPHSIHFVVKTGKSSPPNPPKVGRGAQFRCLCCDNIPTEQYIKNEGIAKRMGTQLMAIVAEGQHGRVYLAPNEEHIMVTTSLEPRWKPEQEMPKNPRWFSPPMYGMDTFGDLFTPRQLVALTTFSDLVQEARQRVLTDARAAWLSDDECSLNDGGTGPIAYADAVATYLGMNVSRLANRSATLCFWDTLGENVQQVFARQALPMVWDFVEGNPFSNSSGNFMGQIEYMTAVVESHSFEVKGYVEQRDAATQLNSRMPLLISTDPPYYDNIGYADLADFFYIWLRRSLSMVYPDLFKTMLVPKAAELVATPHRFGGSKSKARAFFEAGLCRAFELMRAVQHQDYPLTVYYAFKQAESNVDRHIVDEDGNQNGSSSTVVASTGWETMLESLVGSGFTITGTWPMRTELVTNLKKNISSLASSIVLVCRPRPTNAPVA